MEQLKQSKDYGSTCAVTGGHVNRAEQMKRIHRLRNKIHKDCMDLQMSEKKARDDKSYKIFKDGQRMFTKVTGERITNEKRAES